MKGMQKCRNAGKTEKIWHIGNERKRKERRIQKESTELTGAVTRGLDAH